MTKCLRCGAADLESGSLLVRGTGDRDIRFRRDGAGWFSFKDQVRAVACRACGHVELVLEGVRLSAEESEPLAGGKPDARITPSPG
jgi:predicted nucleic-acid-binding Zn-ribbon protein